MIFVTSETLFQKCQQVGVNLMFPLLILNECLKILSSFNEARPACYCNHSPDVTSTLAAVPQIMFFSAINGGKNILRVYYFYNLVCITKRSIEMKWLTVPC